MDIVEKLDEWIVDYESGFLAHLRKTGEMDWGNLYHAPRNRQVDGVKGIDLSKSKLMLISSSGAYVQGEQEAFDKEDDEGDYSVRTFWKNRPFSDLDYSHHSYDTTAVKDDPNVLLPLDYLRDMEADGEIGEVAPTVVSFMGYQPHVGRVVNEMIPSIVALAKAEKIDGALLVPA